MRENFEKHLSWYIETRIIFKKHLNKVQSLVNMLALLESEPDEVKPKLKAKIKELLENGQSWALKVGKCFNFLTNWSMSMTPEIQGSYNL